MIFSFDFSFQMQFHQNQCVSANVSPLVKWHLLTEKCFVGKFLSGSCQEPATCCERSEGSRRRPASADKLRAGLFKPCCYCRTADARRPVRGLCPLLSSPAARAALGEGSRTHTQLSPCWSKALDRAPRLGSECHPGTSGTAACFPCRGGDGGEMSLIPIR